MWAPSTSKDTSKNTSTVYGIPLNDNIDHTAIHQSSSGQNERSVPEVVINDLSEDGSYTKNDEDIMSMDATEMIEDVAMPTAHTIEYNITPETGPSYLFSNLPAYGQHSISPNVSYQAKCASPTTSAQRCRQWQILGGGFGDGYEILLPEEAQVDRESEKESDKESDLGDDINLFLEQIIAAQVRKMAQHQDEEDGASSSHFKCICLHPKCRVNQYFLKNVTTNAAMINEGTMRYDNNKSLAISRNNSSKVFKTHPGSDVLPDQNSTNSGGSRAMLNMVLKNKEQLNLSPNPSQAGIISHATPRRNVNCLSSQNISPQHHPNQRQVETSAVGVPLWEQQYQPGYGSRSARKSDYVSCYSMPDLPKHCSTELQKAHADILLRAGGMTRVGRLFNELVLLSRCLGGWRALLETSPKDGNTLLMWLCCLPLKPGSGMRTQGSTGDINDPLYSQIVAVAMAMISDAYENDTKDTEDKCLLFARNSEEASALELAALTNKSVIASWLALLYPSFGRDVNETNREGQSVLHLLARIGDEAADTLQTLLKLQRPSTSTFLTPSERMFRLDIVNNGAKTPLDVAVACAELYGSTDGVSGTRYLQVISCFHEMIAEEAEEFEIKMALDSHRRNDNKNNISITTQKKVYRDN